MPPVTLLRLNQRLFVSTQPNPNEPRHNSYSTRRGPHLSHNSLAMSQSGIVVSVVGKSINLSVFYPGRVSCRCLCRQLTCALTQRRRRPPIVHSGDARFAGRRAVVGATHADTRRAHATTRIALCRATWCVRPPTGTPARRSSPPSLRRPQIAAATPKRPNARNRPNSCRFRSSFKC